MKHEAYIPTKQTETEENFWVSRPYENGRGAQGHSAQTPRWEKSSLCLRRGDKLRKRAEFVRLARQGKRRGGEWIFVEFRKAPEARLGITASGRYGNSPERSRFKRLVREAFRTARAQLPSDLEINVLPRQRAKEAKMGDIRQELIRLLTC